MKPKRRRKAFKYKQYLTCRICGRKLRSVNAAHLETHGVTVEDYKSAHGVDFVISEATRALMSGERNRRSADPFPARGRKQILAAIRRLSMLKGRAYSKAIREDAWIIVQARSLFGSWGEALRAAGVPPKRTLWSREEVVRRIRDMAARQAKLSVSAAWQVDTGLVSAAFRHWGSWLKAIRAAGVDYQPGRRGRTPEELEKQARAWCARHGPLCSGRLIATDRGLLKALRRRFGNLEDAAEQLKLPYRPLKRKGLTAGEVLRRIAKRIRSGETMIARSVRAGDPGLHYGGCRHFGSWGAAREAARRALRARRRSRER